MTHKISSLLLFAAALAGCTGEDKNADKAESAITAADLKDHISVLASDAFLGRAPATEGETKTIHYLAEEFGKLGLQPGNNGSWFQEVPLVKMTADSSMALRITGGKTPLTLRYMKDLIGNTPQVTDKIDLENSDVVFVGYGINAPEYGWNDYDGIDVKGKTVIILVNDPGYATGDTALFTGKAMTYYGRWTYKYEEAARQGAAAAIIIHETGAASYPWEVVQNSWSGPQFSLPDDELATSPLKFKAWVTTDAAKKIFESAGIDYLQAVESAPRRGFKPVAMNLKASVQFGNKVERTMSNNVIAVLPGKTRPDEFIIYTAHWDHFGVNPAFKPDSIFNGAVDNATGTAALLEIARAFKARPENQDRSVIFMAVTCEEQGLLGSQYYTEHPVYPLAKTAGVINMDALNIFGRTRDMTIIGYGNSRLDDFAIKALKRHGRYAIPDPTPEKGSYFRSDHFSFAKAGVPALYLDEGIDDIAHGKEWALARIEKWTMENYHKPSDNYEPDKWDFDGLIDDIKIYFETGYYLSMSGEFPEWSSKFPFKPLRDKMMKEAEK